MKKYLSFMLGVLFILGILIPAPADAQVYGEFEPPVKVLKGSYADLVSDVLLNRDSFKRVPLVSNVDDTINGYHKIPIGFEFQFNGNIYSELWVCINGFVTFNNPLLIAQNEPDALFSFDGARYQNNVIAPYLGNHCYRSTSRISYKVEDGAALAIQWKDLNVNDPTDPNRVASFQLRLYKSTDTLSKQGDIEFSYGSVGMNVGIGAAIGIKGGSFNDFLNALLWNDHSRARVATTKTLIYPPTGGTDSVFLFRPIVRYGDSTSWGDGDVDMSKKTEHKDLPQKRFVTVNDAYLIVNSLATRTPLDSVIGSNAFHGDVNHNGRYYYDLTQKKVKIPWRDLYYDQNVNVPPYVNVPSKNSIFFEVTEYDAALILHYLGARIPKLPWLIDTIVQYGKSIPQELIADNISLGEITRVSENKYTFPLFLNGFFNGTIASKFEFNADILEAESNLNSENFLIDYSNGIFVLAGSGEIDKSNPVAYITISSSDKELNVSDLTFNDNELDNQSYRLPVDQNISNALLLQNTPNPFANSTSIVVNIAEEGNYTLSIYDLSGNRVKVLENDFLSVGQYTYHFDGIDSNGNQLSNGMYIYKLTSANVSASMKMMLNR